MRRNFRTIKILVLLITVCVSLSGCKMWDQIISDGIKDDISTEAYLSDEERVDEEAEYVLARQTGILGDDWKSFTVKLNHVVISLPSSVMYLERAGLEMDTSFMAEDTLVNRGNRESVYFKNEFGDAILVTFMNPDRTPCALKDCLITGIAVTEYDLYGGHLTVTFPGGVELYSEMSVALSAYGRDFEIYESDSVHMYTWYDKKSYYKSCEIDYDPKTRKATSMFINF